MGLGFTDVFIAWVLLVVLGCVACYLPARRALAIEPGTHHGCREEAPSWPANTGRVV
jgi:hypothetical protein